MLIAQNLSKTYETKVKKGLFKPTVKTTKQAVDQVSLCIKPGEIVGLLGINGAGKTTTIKMLSGILQPDNGHYFLDNIDGIKEYRKIKPLLNVISGGERNLYWRITARENLNYFAALYGLTGSAKSKRIDELLDQVGLLTVADQPVEQFSKGMKQRLQFARGLVNKPRYLFLDEPTLGLDVAIARELRETVKRLAEEQNCGILLTTHYIQEAEYLCNNIIVLDNGKVIAEGKPEHLKTILGEQHCLELLCESRTAHIETQLKHIALANNLTVTFAENRALFTGDIIEIPRITEQLLAQSIPFSSLKLTDRPLEDVLMELSQTAKQTAA
jgi:ABC-2 type transport system ATP-binding protein